ncbi:MAG: DNA-binding protein [Brevibacterium sp.]|nr:DNA-binding protein [Brevibacterium sp.]
MARLEGVNTEELVQDWATLPDIAESTGLGITQVHRLMEDGAICGYKHGKPKVMRVPTAFFVDGAVLSPLKGTLSTLRDAGFDDRESIDWLFTPDDSLPGRPIDLLRAGNRKEVRRRAQALAF